MLFAERITVREIARMRLAPAAPAEDAGQVRRRMEEADYDVMPLADGNGRITAFVCREELGEGRCGDHARAITVENLIADSTPLIHALGFLADRPWMFVLESGAVTGILTRADANRPQVRMMLFAFITLAEMKLNALIDYHHPESSWINLLSAERLKRAEELQAQRNKVNEALTLRDCLQLCDKRTIVTKTPAILHAMRLDKARAGELLKRMERVRDELAHAQQDYMAVLPWPEVHSLLDGMIALLDAWDGELHLDLSSEPSERAIDLVHQAEAKALAESIGAQLALDAEDRTALAQAIVGAVAHVVDESFLDR